ncbi:defense protein 6-like [Branchiostoma floridae]|uniref:Defense protein 6-like n=1 Tax=Branchiostoma floridae TaxID=7739 RepID=A0A9J7LI39_BRAFL|nr:defense protein 6-like [Branchiostoma floridae]
MKLIVVAIVLTVLATTQAFPKDKPKVEQAPRVYGLCNDPILSWMQCNSYCISTGYASGHCVLQSCICQSYNGLAVPVARAPVKNRA